jgi:hypothetical protein
MAFVAVKLLNIRVTFSEDLFERFRPTVPSPNPNDLRWKSKQQARRCLKTPGAPKGRASTALGSAQGFEAKTSRTQPCKGEIPWFVAPLQGLREWEMGLDDPGRWPGLC